MLKQRFEIVKIKDRFARPTPEGYRDMLINVRASSGHVMEVQLHLKQILEVKEGAGHKLYEEIRSIIARAKTEDRALTAQELNRVLELRTESKKLYDKAWKEANKGG